MPRNTLTEEEMWEKFDLENSDLIGEEDEVRQAAFAAELQLNPPYTQEYNSDVVFPRDIDNGISDLVGVEEVVQRTKFWGRNLGGWTLMNDNINEEKLEEFWENWLLFLDLPAGNETQIRLALLGIENTINLLGPDVTTKSLVTYVKTRVSF